MLKGFKDFLLRGNVIDLAVAVVIGAAFTALVTAFSDNIIEPVLNAFGGADAGSLGFNVVPGNEATRVNIGAVMTAAITFLITAAVVYFVFVGPMKRLTSLLAVNKVAVKADPTEVELLVQIRDLLSRVALPVPADQGPTDPAVTGAADGPAMTPTPPTPPAR